MSITNPELQELISEFAAIRQDGKKNSFPEAIWRKAISIAQKLPFLVVCQAINVHPQGS